MTPLIKFISKTYLLALILWVTSAAVGMAQIRDDDASKKSLAAHCAISGGGNAANYQSYASSLAKTLSQLTPAEQDEVLNPTNVNGGNSGEGDSGGDGTFENGVGSGGGDGSENEGGDGSENGGGGTGEENSDDEGETGEGAGDDDSGDDDSGSGATDWGAWLSAWWESLWSATTEPDSFLNIAQSGEPTTAVSFGSAVITETIASGDRSKTSAFTQARHTSGQVTLRQETTQSTTPGKLEFKNGNLEFLTTSKEGK